MNENLIVKAKKVSQCVYLACHKEVADDISNCIISLIGEITHLSRIKEAAIADLKSIGRCNLCVGGSADCPNNNSTNDHDCTNWTWRGVQSND